MLAKKYRLNLSLKDNSLLFNKANSITLSSKFFLTYFRRNENHLKITCIPPKGALDKATQRNFYRRLMYSFLEEKIKTNNNLLSKKIDIVIVLKRKFSEGKGMLKQDFLNLVEKIIDAKTL